jgi:hypothetical protein
MRSRAVVRPLTAALLVLSVAACPGPAPVDCRVGADCASGVCLRDGRCAPEGPIDAGSGDAGQPDAGGLEDAGQPLDAGADAGVDAGQPVGCLPNHDGQIDRGEVFFQAGLRATFRVSGQTSFVTAGTVASDGGGLWDFTSELTGDTSRLIETRALTGEWFESEYPDGGYVAELGQGSDLLGVFSTTADALYLQGVVSATDGLTSTRVRYEPWVKVLQFPLRAGDAWETNTTVSGRFNGLVIGFNLPFQSERYQSTVDREGTAKTPFADFPVLRVRTVMTRSLNAIPSLTLRTFSWNTECFGTVAAVTSRDNETSTDFTTAAEVRRLSP